MPCGRSIGCHMSGGFGIFRVPSGPMESFHRHHSRASMWLKNILINGM